MVLKYIHKMFRMIDDNTGSYIVDRREGNTYSL